MQHLQILKYPLIAIRLHFFAMEHNLKKSLEAHLQLKIFVPLIVLA